MAEVVLNLGEDGFTDEQIEAASDNVEFYFGALYPTTPAVNNVNPASQDGEGIYDTRIAYNFGIQSTLDSIYLYEIANANANGAPTPASLHASSLLEIYYPNLTEIESTDVREIATGLNTAWVAQEMYEGILMRIQREQVAELGLLDESGQVDPEQMNAYTDAKSVPIMLKVAQMVTNGQISPLFSNPDTNNILQPDLLVPYYQALSGDTGSRGEEVSADILNIFSNN